MVGRQSAMLFVLAFLSIVSKSATVSSVPTIGHLLNRRRWPDSARHVLVLGVEPLFAHGRDHFADLDAVSLCSVAGTWTPFSLAPTGSPEQQSPPVASM
jgi:hypothetical protein